MLCLSAPVLLQKMLDVATFQQVYTRKTSLSSPQNRSTNSLSNTLLSSENIKMSSRVFEKIVGKKCHFFLTLPSEFDQAVEKIPEILAKKASPKG